MSLSGKSDFLLHRNLKSLMPSLEAGEFRIIPNAGLPLNEWNGSHFVSQDFWAMAEYEGNRNPTGVKGTGWVGRLLEKDGMQVSKFQRTAIAMGSLTPLVLQGQRVSGIAWPGLEAAETMKSQVESWLSNMPPIENNAVYQEMAQAEAQQGQPSSEEEVKLQYLTAKSAIEIDTKKKLADISVGKAAISHAQRTEQRKEQGITQLALQKAKARAEIQKAKGKMAAMKEAKATGKPMKKTAKKTAKKMVMKKMGNKY